MNVAIRSDILWLWFPNGLIYQKYRKLFLNIFYFDILSQADIFMEKYAMNVIPSPATPQSQTHGLLFSFRDISGEEGVEKVATRSSGKLCMRLLLKSISWIFGVLMVIGARWSWLEDKSRRCKNTEGKQTMHYELARVKADIGRQSQ